MHSEDLFGQDGWYPRWPSQVHNVHRVSADLTGRCLRRSLNGHTRAFAQPPNHVLKFARALGLREFAQACGWEPRDVSFFSIPAGQLRPTKSYGSFVQTGMCRTDLNTRTDLFQSGVACSCPASRPHDGHRPTPAWSLCPVQRRPDRESSSNLWVRFSGLLHQHPATVP